MLVGDIPIELTGPRVEGDSVVYGVRPAKEFTDQLAAFVVTRADQFPVEVQVNFDGGRLLSIEVGTHRFVPLRADDDTANLPGLHVYDLQLSTGGLRLRDDPARFSHGGAS